jgi:hypothetical protein
VSHAAVYSEVLFWFVVVLTLLLLMMLIGVVVRPPPGTVGRGQPLELNPRPPPQPRLVGWPQAAGPADAAMRSARAGYRPSHAGALKPELVAAGRLQLSSGPPWGPAPKPPEPRPSLYAKSASCVAGMTGPDRDRLRPAQITAASTVSGVRAGAHRRVRRQGAHRAGISTGHARGSAGRAGRHRAGVH